MANNIRDQINEAGKQVGECATKAVDWVKEKAGMGPAEGSDAGAAAIQPHMDVIASCGTKVGVVDRVEGGAIKLTKDSCGDGMHHFLPAAMVARVDRHVHLNKNADEALAGWKPNAQSCNACGG